MTKRKASRAAGRQAQGGRVFKRAGPLFAVRRSGIHGKGAFALRRIAKGTRIIEYKGRIISWKEVNRLYPDDDEDRQNHTFLFEIDDEKVIDANVGGNSARWINHSCTPNCEATGDGDRVFIEAIRDIAPGAELAYDYNIQLPERHTPTVKRRYMCACGTRKCRGTILGKKR